MTPPTECTPAAALRAATTTAHQQTEKSLVSRIKAIGSASDYCSLLACLYGYFSPLEKETEPLLSGVLPDHRRRRKSDRLLQDIETLQPGFPLRFATAPKIATTPAALGYAYVMEGSVLGGAVIKKMIGTRHPDISQEAFGFFSGYGEENGTMWGTFLSALNGALVVEAEKSEAITAAGYCFTGMGEWIEAWYAGA